MKQHALCCSYTRTKPMRPIQLAAHSLLQVICEVVKLFHLPGTFERLPVQHPARNLFDSLSKHVRARNDI